MGWFDSFSPDTFRQTITGLNFLSAGLNYQADKAKAKAQKKWQAYTNAMTNISNAMNQSAISQNESMAVEQSLMEAVNIQRGGILTEAKAEVQAAAAGVAGRSVNQTILDIQSNAAAKERARQINLENTLSGYAQQRTQSAFQAQLNQDYSFIAKPSASTALFGAAMDSMKVWEDRRTNDIIWNT